MGHFGDRLIARARALRHPLCVGLDPHLSRIPMSFRAGEMSPADPATAEAVERFCTAVAERVAGRVVAVKPQSAFFEALGWPGVRALARVVARCRDLDLPVLLDAKRGDIGSTAEGYARAYLARNAPLRADALTVNPYLGLETLEPYFKEAAQSGAGVFVLVKTSNPGSGDLQDLEVGGEPVWARLTARLGGPAAALRGTETGWSSLGVVVGATYPEQLEQVRERLPHALQLVPGYGAQGAAASEAVRGLVAGPAGREGGIVNSSRAILFPEGAGDGDLARWEAAFDAALERAIEELGRAVA